jgi:hypothetical protein
MFLVIIPLLGCLKIFIKEVGDRYTIARRWFKVSYAMSHESHDARSNSLSPTSLSVPKYIEYLGYDSSLMFAQETANQIHPDALDLSAKVDPKRRGTLKLGSKAPLATNLHRQLHAGSPNEVDSRSPNPERTSSSHQETIQTQKKMANPTPAVPIFPTRAKTPW